MRGDEGRRLEGRLFMHGIALFGLPAVAGRLSLFRVPEYQALFVAQLARDLAGRIDRLTKGFPSAERFELTSQLRRAAVSVPANLLEGRALHGPRNYLRHVRIAIGSLQEVAFLIETSAERAYIDARELRDMTDRIRHVRVLLYRLARSLERAAERA